MNNKEIGVLALSVCGFCLSIIAVILDAKRGKQINKVTDMIGATVDELADGVEVDIAKEFIEEATKRHVERRVDQMLPGVKNDVVRSATEAFKAAVDSEINKQYIDTRGEVKRALKERIGRIDIDSVKREVIEESEAWAKDQFKEDLSRVVDKYVDRLEDASDVWAAFKEKLS